ncbi:MAG: pre-peptidase C-terminal domain-containing protein [Pseudohongiellaceae bacterium]|jgi:hypothetical protein
MKFKSSLLLLAFTPLIFAQDISETATFGEIDLAGGFLPDPYSIELTAGGNSNAADLGNNCVGNIANAPDVQLSYESGSLPIIFSVGSESDTTLVINLPDGSWLCDDDSGDGLSPMIELSDAPSGIYDIWIGSYDEDSYPSAILYISELSANYASTLEDNAMESSVSGLAGVVYNESLSATDNVEEDGAYSDSYIFDANSGDEAIIDLRSEGFDSYLRLISPSGEVFTNDDYEGDTSRSLISQTLNESGTYTVIVTSFFESETGDYALGINTDQSSTATIDLDVTGSLTSTDIQTEDGEYVDYYEFVGTPGHTIVVDLTSDDFDTYLGLESPSGQYFENDDADSIYHSQIETRLDESGTYYVYVTSYGAGATGDYSLSVSETGTVSSNANNASDTRNIVLDERVAGSLLAGDSLNEDNKYTDYYSFTGSAGQNVRFELSSQDFDTYLTIIDPNGSEYDNDDFDGSTGMSVVELALPVSGRYSVLVTSYRTEETGNYNLGALSSSAPASIFASNSTSTSGSQVYGIFVGISDYSQLRQTQFGWGDLPFTADDALVARDSLLNSAGMDPSNAITLLDRDATVENVRAAFAELSTRMESDDTFVFFYSGHGGQEQRAGGFVASDADGYDETLALSNNTITDDEVNELFNQLSAGTQLIILDSCFSGGFAKDVISRPGRMGLFSSDEDVPSLVAGKFQAGGYLSYFFQDAITGGNADFDGDNSINAMELSQYIHERYNFESLSKGPSTFDTPDFGYQHLVADRGGVTHDQILFNVR